MGKYNLFLVMVLIGSFMTACDEKEAVFTPAISALSQKADALHQAGQTGQAICRLESAADIAPDTFQLQYNLGVLYTETHQWPKAVEHLEAATKVSPGQANGFFSLAFAYESWGDDLKKQSKASAETYQKAITAYQQFLKTSPSTDPGRQNAQAEITRLQHLASAG